MGAPEDRPATLDELDRRIRAARGVRAPQQAKQGDKFAATGMAWRMTFELVVAAMIGAAMGWGLDALFGTLPLFLIVFILLGFGAGIRTVMRSAEELQRKQTAAAVQDQAAEAALKNDSANRDTTARGE
jgi:ATP synthase protein I